MKEEAYSMLEEKIKNINKEKYFTKNLS